MTIRLDWSGAGGQIKVPGLGAVLATIASWTLKGRGENRRERPMWDLHGSLSYVNETLYRSLIENDYPMAITLTTQGKTYKVDFDIANVDIQDSRLIVKEITLDDH